MQELERTYADALDSISYKQFFKAATELYKYKLTFKEAICLIVVHSYIDKHWTSPHLAGSDLYDQFGPDVVNTYRSLFEPVNRLC